MIVNSANLRDLFTGYSAAFRNGFTTAKSDWPVVATKVPSSAKEVHYAWLGQFPKLREWLGDRVVNQMRVYDYRIQNKKFESTIAVKRDEIGDDQYGVYTPLMQAMGEAARTHPDELLFPLLNAGFTGLCYDGQYFFDTDHPVGRENDISSVSNFGGGSGTPWYLMDNSRSVKPLILQLREDYIFRAVTNLEDSRVFETDEFRFGIDGRLNVGYGLWQQAYGSKLDLTPDNFASAYAAMQAFKSDEGRPLGIRPTHLVVPPSLRVAALQIVRDRDNYGAQNVNANLVQVLDSPWLA